MSDNRKRVGKRHGANSQAPKWPEKVKLSWACKFSGISSSNLSNLVSSEKLSIKEDPLD
jgi:hypothetical protein